MHQSKYSLSCLTSTPPLPYRVRRAWHFELLNCCCHHTHRKPKQLVAIQPQATCFNLARTALEFKSKSKTKTKANWKVEVEVDGKLQVEVAVRARHNWSSAWIRHPYLAACLYLSLSVFPPFSLRLAGFLFSLSLFLPVMLASGICNSKPCRCFEVQTAMRVSAASSTHFSLLLQLPQNVALIEVAAASMRLFNKRKHIVPRLFLIKRAAECKYPVTKQISMLIGKLTSHSRAERKGEGKKEG